VEKQGLYITAPSQVVHIQRAHGASREPFDKRFIKNLHYRAIEDSPHTASYTGATVYGRGWREVLAF